VVVPTSEHVELEYGTTGVELAAWALTFAGIAGLVWLFRAAPVTMPAPVRRRRVRATNGGPDGAGEVLDDAVAVDAGADEPVESSPVALDQPAREVSIGETAVG